MSKALERREQAERLFSRARQSGNDFLSKIFHDYPAIEELFDDDFRNRWNLAFSVAAVGTACRRPGLGLPDGGDLAGLRSALRKGLEGLGPDGPDTADLYSETARHLLENEGLPWSQATGRWLLAYLAPQAPAALRPLLSREAFADAVGSYIEEGFDEYWLPKDKDPFPEEGPQ